VLLWEEAKGMELDQGLEQVSDLELVQMLVQQLEQTMESKLEAEKDARLEDQLAHVLGVL
jgi:hypothetical protein